MPARVQRYPLGLLGLLNIKDYGQGPSLFSDEISAVIDATAFYLTAQRNGAGGQAGPINATGFFGVAGIAPANQEVWQCDWVSAAPSAVLGAATTVRFRLALSRANGARFYAISDAVTGTTGERPMAYAQNIILTPGDVLGVWVDAWTAGGVAFNANVFVGQSILNY